MASTRSKFIVALIVTTSGYVAYKYFSHSDTFEGKRRADVKTNIASGKPQVFNIPQLYEYLLPMNEFMEDNVRHETPRTIIENDNVTVTCWLYTYNCQDDNDFHLIIGSAPLKDDAQFFSAEVSGLPSEDSPNYKYYDRLEKAREQFGDLFGGSPSYSGAYVKSLYANPMKVTITGSLFWDTEHTGGKCCSGTGEYKSESPWEIHPVTSIKKAN